MTIWIMSLPSAGDAEPLTDAIDYKYTALAWHPDGRQIAAVRFNQAAITEPPEIWLLDISGRAILLQIVGYDPQWIP